MITVFSAITFGWAPFFALLVDTHNSTRTVVTSLGLQIQAQVSQIAVWIWNCISERYVYYGHKRSK